VFWLYQGELKSRLGSTLVVLREVRESGSELNLEDMMKERMSFGWVRLETGLAVFILFEIYFLLSSLQFSKSKPKGIVMQQDMVFTTLT